MAVEEKWKANQEKVAFMKRFPGLLAAWEQTRGKTVEAVKPLKTKPDAAVLVFSDGSFTVAAPIRPEPHELGDGLAVARPELEPRQSEAYTELDRLVRKDKEALRAARAEKILGAIQNNLEQIPELKDRIRRLVESWKAGDGRG